MAQRARGQAGRGPRGKAAARWRIGLALAAGLGPVGLAAPGSFAQQPAPAPAPAAGPRPVDLDKLMKLPSGLEVDVDKRGGATRSEWRARFREARAESEEARAALQKAQSKLEGAAAESDSAWRMAPPGANTTAESTERYPLTLEVKRQRAEVERTDRRLRELEIEANLAGVPKDWRE